MSHDSHFRAGLSHLAAPIEDCMFAYRGSMDPRDLRRLSAAVRNLEEQSFAISVTNKIGVPINGLMKLLPERTHASISSAVNKTLEQCLRVALSSMRGRASRTPNKRMHKLVTAATGAAGGFFGLPGLAVELPVTTTAMLRSIAEIARSHGEDLTDPRSALACLEVLALGNNAGARNTVESAFYASRAALAQVTREGASYLAEKGLTRTGAPPLLQFLSKIAARFGVEVTEKAAAQLVPLIGAAGGMALNVVFTSHFQKLAEGHFEVRQLERAYGPDAVRVEYDRLRAARSAR